MPPRCRLAARAEKDVVSAHSFTPDRGAASRTWLAVTIAHPHMAADLHLDGLGGPADLLNPPCHNRTDRAVQTIDIRSRDS
jgi:hypothetical protein